MYNATIRTSAFIFSILLMVASSCKNKNENASNNSANELYSLAEKEYNNSNYEESIKLVDSLKRTFPDEIDIQKKAMHLWALNNEKVTVKELLENENKYNIAVNTIEKLKPRFKYVKTRDMVEGYKIERSVNSDINRTGIEVRIDDSYNIYIVSSVVGKNINHNQISVSGANSSVSSKSIPYDGSTNYRYNDAGTSHELVTFRGAESDSICAFISTNSNYNLKVNFIGKRRYSQSLSKNEKQIISNTYDYVSAIRLAQEAEKEKLYLTKKLQIAQSQIEKTKL